MTQILDLTHSLADRFYQEGVNLEEVGEMERAMQAFERALHADHSHAGAHIALAYHFRRLERLDQAVAHCKSALSHRPDASSHFALGHMLIAEQRYEPALAALRRCLDLEPNYDQARYQIAFIYYLKGEYEVAITEFHRAAQYEADWETLFFLGECYRMTRRPAEAEHIFRRALTMTNSWGQVEITRGQLAACRRLAEFPAQHPLSVKDRAYCDCGVVYLGSGNDDGLNISPYLFYKFDYKDVAVTVQRFLALREEQAWQWDAVVPVDIISLPLALAIASVMDVGTEPMRGGRTLVVQALGETVEGLQDATERLPNVTTFCLLACWPEEWRPDIVGLATPLLGSVPWYQTGAINYLHATLFGDEEAAKVLKQPWQDDRPPEIIARDILSALAECDDDPKLPDLLAYYRQHAQLRWHL